MFDRRNKLEKIFESDVTTLINDEFINCITGTTSMLTLIINDNTDFIL